MGNSANKKLITAISDIKYNSSRAVELIDKCDPDYLDKNNRSLIYHACVYKRAELVKIMIDKKFDMKTPPYSRYYINTRKTGTKKSYEYTPMMVAFKNNMTDVGHKLLDAGCTPNYMTSEKRTILHEISTSSDEKLTLRLIELTDDLEHRNNYGWNVLRYTISCDLSLVIFNKLLEKGCDIYQRYYDGDYDYDGNYYHTLISQACIDGSDKYINLLLDMKCDTFNTLDVACTHPILPREIIMRLLHSGCDPNNDYGVTSLPPLVELCKNEYFDILIYILDHYSLDILKTRGGEIFTVACSKSNLEIMKRLYMYEDESTYENKTAMEWITRNNIIIPDEMIFEKNKTLSDMSKNLLWENQKLLREKSYIRLLINHVDLNTSYLVCEYL